MDRIIQLKEISRLNDVIINKKYTKKILKNCFSELCNEAPASIVITPTKENSKKFSYSITMHNKTLHRCVNYPEYINQRWLKKKLVFPYCPEYENIGFFNKNKITKALAYCLEQNYFIPLGKIYFVRNSFFKNKELGLVIPAKNNIYINIDNCFDFEDDFYKEMCFYETLFHEFFHLTKRHIDWEFRDFYFLNKEEDYAEWFGRYMATKYLQLKEKGLL